MDRSPTGQALRRVGVKPLRVLFDLVRGPAAAAARWRGLLVCAIDGTTMFVPDSAANVACFGRHGGGHAVAGYPMLRLLAVVACGTRTVIDTVFGTDKIAEITYAPSQVIHAAGVLEATTVDLIGRIGAAVLAAPLPARRQRSSPRVVKRAISKHRAKGDIDHNTYPTTITVEILDG
ncbi:hypothetical protein [Nocardia jiangxiensis]|uniref:Transposase DDE domain-containing protein n=1 Tax=Nocardia jiangxiensis TaxID=282685 RepID=A0ABW6SAR2_9NOCA|nr:hypothetical protein [Nocardia jiangxiensis]